LLEPIRPPAGKADPPSGRQSRSALRPAEPIRPPAGRADPPSGRQSRSALWGS